VGGNLRVEKLLKGGGGGEAAASRDVIINSPLYLNIVEASNFPRPLAKTM
jgi:hypothetical protein